MQLEMQNIINLILNNLAGLIASWMFWKFLHLVQPKIQISPQIAKSYSKEKDGEMIYKIKIINYSNRQIINLKAELTLAQASSRSDGVRRVTSPLKLKTSELLALGPRNQHGKIWEVSPVWYLVFYSEQDLILNENSRVRVIVSATDALTSTTVVFSQSYGENSIIEGDFAYGIQFNIK